MDLMKWTYLAFLLAISCEVCFSHRVIIHTENQVPTLEEAKPEGPNIGGSLLRIWRWPFRGDKIIPVIGNKEKQDSLPLDGKEKQDSMPLNGKVKQDSVPLNGKVKQDSVPLNGKVKQDLVPLNGKIKQDSLPESIAYETIPSSKGENINVVEIYGTYDIQEHKINQEEKNVEATPPAS